MILYISFNFYIYFIGAIFVRAFKSFDRMACSFLGLKLLVCCDYLFILLNLADFWVNSGCCYFSLILHSAHSTKLPDYYRMRFFFSSLFSNPADSNIVYSFHTWLRFPMMAPWNPSSYSFNRSHWLCDGCLSIWFVSNVPFNHLQHFNCLLISVDWLARIK